MFFVSYKSSKVECIVHRTTHFKCIILKKKTINKRQYVNGSELNLYHIKRKPDYVCLKTDSRQKLTQSEFYYALINSHKS